MVGVPTTVRAGIGVSLGAAKMVPIENMKTVVMSTIRTHTLRSQPIELTNGMVCQRERQVLRIGCGRSETITAQVPY